MIHASVPLRHRNNSAHAVVAVGTARVFSLVACVAAVLAALAGTARANLWFYPGNLVVTRSVYVGTSTTITNGQALPSGGIAITNGVYPYVFNNDSADGSFAVGAPVYVDQVTTAGALINTLPIPFNPQNGGLVTSFESKSELAVNLSQDGSALTFMGYVATTNQLDISNSNTPNHIDPTNPDTGIVQRAVAMIDYSGAVQVTPVNAYTGDNGRGVIMGNNVNGTGTNYFYMVGNAGNGSGTESNIVVDNTGVQMTTPGGGPETTVVGVQQGTPGSKNGYQYGYSVVQNGLPADKSGKDNNYRGITIFNNTLYCSKGSGGNGIDAVFQVGTTGSLPTSATASSTAINLLAGMPTTSAKSNTANIFPFGMWFANASTLYVADEGDGVYTDATTDAEAGLQKWALTNGTWTLLYTLQQGLNLGVSYIVPGYPTGTNSLTGLPWAPETDGLRNITGQVNTDGTVTIYAITSTVSGSGDQGADPNALVAITDTLSYTTAVQAAGEQFTTLRSANSGELYRGVAFAPTPPITNYVAVLPVTVGISGSDAVVSFPTIVDSNFLYSVQSSPDLVAGPWTTIASNIAADGSIATNLDPGAAATATQKFYRVEVSGGP
jgi:hypothetical protein